MTPTHAFTAETDLKIDRLIHAAPEAVWRCWQDPELFKRWFVPDPVRVTDCALELTPGGRFFTEMTLPDGTVMPSDGVFLIVETGQRLIYTDALGMGFRPTGGGFMTVEVTLTPEALGTRYAATILHATAEARQSHVDMGFEGGWGTTLAQLDALAQSL